MMTRPSFQLLRSRFVWFVIGIGLTLVVQWVLGPSRIATQRSPDGLFVLIVQKHWRLLSPDRYDFRIEGQGSFSDDVDGSMLVLHEEVSGGWNFQEMKVYWAGQVAVIDFGDARFERMMPDNFDWRRVERAGKPAATQTAPTTQP